MEKANRRGLLPFSLGAGRTPSPQWHGHAGIAERRVLPNPQGGGRNMILALALSLLGLAPPAAGDQSSELLPPVRLEAAGKPIDTAIGHAAPFVADFDGDGVPDLLVGQFGGGLLKIYRNVGTAAAPKLAAGVTFQAGGKDGTVPTG